MQRAHTELDKTTVAHTNWRTSLQRAASSDGWRRCGWICLAYSGVLVVATALKAMDIAVWSSLAPADASDTLATLWQVQAGLVTLGFPLLLLLIQFSRDEGVAALRSSEVIVRETYARAAMELSAVGLVSAGALAAWLHSDGAVIAAILFITVPTVAVLLRSYFVALDLHMDATRLRRKSSELLQEKLRLSMRDLWQIQRANALLFDDLDPIGERGYFDPGPDDLRWLAVSAHKSGRVADIDSRGLLLLIEALPSAGGDASEDIDSVRASSRPKESASQFQLRRVCGDRVDRGDTILLLRRDAFALAASPQLPLDRVVKIEFDER